MLWQAVELERNETGIWQTLALKFAVTHRAMEWIVQYQWENNPLLKDWSYSVINTPPSYKKSARFVSAIESNKLYIDPCLADRAVVAKPNTPFHLLGGEQVGLYVSSPVWVNISIGEHQHRLLQIPLQLASDTWAGSSTKGELCYASRTNAYMQLHQDVLRPHRALTPVTIVNRAQKALLIDRINIPIPYLTAYLNDKILWTNPITIFKEKHQEDDSLVISKDAPKEAAQAKRVCLPIKTSEINVFTKALDMFF